MMDMKLAGTRLPAPDQVCIVVKDLDRAIEYYQSAFGLGPFRTMESATEDMAFRDWAGTARLRIGFAQMGPIELELIQVLEGETPHSEFLRQRGEGLHHIRFPVADLEATLAELARCGIQPVWRHNYEKAGISFAYLNTDQIGGTMFELIEDKRRNAAQ